MIPPSDKKLKIRILLLLSSKIKLMEITNQTINYSQTAITATAKYLIIQALPLQEIPSLAVTNRLKEIPKLT